jgi:hypothetical protein
MQVRQLAFFISFTALLGGCADFYGGQPPAPVYGGSAEDSYENDPYLENQPPPEQAVQQPPPVIETKPLEGINQAPPMVEIKPELPPYTDLNPVTEPPEGTTGLPEMEQPADDQQMPETEPPAEQPKAAEVVTPIEPAIPEEPKKPEELEPLETFAPQTPAVGSLVMAANENSQNGNLDSAVSSIERAIRIEPRNATLYYKLAVLRLKQSKPRLAEDIARKAALLAVNDNSLKKHSWLLIANARELQSNVAGANKAKAEAAKY